MNAHRVKVRNVVALAVAALLLTILFAGSGSIRLGAVEPKSTTLNHKQLKALIVSAKTPEDHLKLATYYQHEAEELKKKAKEHEETAAAYENKPQGPAAKNPGMMSGTVHCQNFAKLDAEEVKEAEPLASMHEAMAKAAAEKERSRRRSSRGPG